MKGICLYVLIVYLILLPYFLRFKCIFIFHKILFWKKHNNCNLVKNNYCTYMTICVLHNFHKGQSSLYHIYYRYLELSYFAGMIWSSNTYNTMHIHIWIFCKRICLVSYCGSQVIQIRVLFFINLKGDSMIWHMRSSTDQRLMLRQCVCSPLNCIHIYINTIGFLYRIPNFGQNIMYASIDMHMNSRSDTMNMNKLDTHFFQGIFHH